MTVEPSLTGEEAIASLTAEVEALRRTVHKLAEMLVRSGAISDAEHRELVRSAQRTTGCTICGKALSALGPGFTLGNHGSVCPICFTRGG